MKTEVLAQQPWPLHRRVAAAALRAAPFGPVVAALVVAFDGWGTNAAGAGAYAAVATLALFLLERRGAGPGEALARLAGAAVLAAGLGLVAAGWVVALLEQGPLGAYQALGEHLELGWRTCRALEGGTWGTALAAAALAPAWVARAAGRRVLSQLGAAAGAAGLLALGVGIWSCHCDAGTIALVLGAVAASTSGGVVLAGALGDLAAGRFALGDPSPTGAITTSRAGRALPWLASAGVFVALVVVFGDPLGHHHCHRPGYESSAIGSLRTISTAQVMFQEGDRDADGAPDFAASLRELQDGQLIDPVLASGTKYGYRFWVFRPADPEAAQERWAAVARPLVPGTTGDRTFFANHQGTIWYTSSASPLVLVLPDCEPPPGLTPLGQ